MKETRWKESSRRSEIARRCSHRGRDRYDARYEIARKPGPCAWPSATTSRHSPSKEMLRSQRPRSGVAANSMIRCADLAPRRRLRSGWATSPDVRWRSQELTTENFERAGEAHLNAAVATQIDTTVTAARRTGNPAAAC